MFNWTGWLMKFFNNNIFKDWQLRTIKAVIGGKNALAVQPTGCGKSLCYPCSITGNITVVLFPTISLIMEQVKALD